MPARPLKTKVAASSRPSPAPVRRRAAASAGLAAPPGEASPPGQASTTGKAGAPGKATPSDKAATPRKPAAPQPRPPAAPSLPRGMARFAITLKDDPAPPGGSRGRFVRGRLDRSERFRAQLLDWLQAQGLAARVADVGAATAFNVLSIVTTAQVAHRLAALEGVESVLPDMAVRIRRHHPVSHGAA